MITSNHIIQKVVVEIDTNSMKVANSLKNNSNAFIQNELLPLIEKELNGLYVGENEILQIEKINISVDANTSNVDYTFKSDFKEEVKQQLQKKLENAIKELKLENSSNEVNTLVSEIGKKRNTLFYFLTHGRMPWWISKSDGNFFSNDNLSEIVSDSNFKEQFRIQISNKDVQKRLLSQFNNSQIALFLSSQKQKGSQNNVATISTNKIIKLLSTESVQFKKEFWTTFFNYLSTNDAENILSFYDEKLQLWPFSFSEFIRELRLFIPISKTVLTATSEEKLTSTNTTTSKETLSSISENQNSSEIEKSEAKDSNNQSQTTVNSDLENNPEKGIMGEKTTSTVTESTIETQQKSSIEHSVSNHQDTSNNEASSIETNSNLKENTAVNNKKIDSVSELDANDQNSESLEDNYTNSELLKKGVYVENAGLILLHPFLKMLFQNCNLLDEKNTIINKELAVHILHFAATKQEQDYEYTMLFEKFLCGLPLEYPIKREVDIEEYQKNHVEELLTAVVSHWTTLKNSSTDILRSEFLQREGKLDSMDANPKLTIEKKTQDILLDKIPWNISIVKIPWIEKIIYTEW